MATRLQKAQYALPMRYRRALRELERCVVEMRAGRIDAVLSVLDADDDRSRD